MSVTGASGSAILAYILPTKGADYVHDGGRAWGQLIAVALFENCRWIGALLGAGANDWSRRRSILILTQANSG